MTRRKLNRHQLIHGTAAVVWFLLFIPSLLWWRDSLVWIVFMSGYANFVGHWSSYEAAKAQK